jgi:hypothetical protein
LRRLAAVMSPAVEPPDSLRGPGTGKSVRYSLWCSTDFRLTGYEVNRLNKRIPEASALRDFFQEQWEHLQQLLEARQAARLQKQDEAARLSSAVETIVEGTDTRLRAIGSYQKRLRKSARELLDYIEGLVADMPLAVEVSQAAYAADSLVNTLFPGTEDMHRLFSRSLPVQEFFKHPENLNWPEVFALLFLTRTEKDIMGSEMRGEIILKEVPQTTVSFSGHQLIAAQASEQAARGALKKTLFESVIQQLKVQITQLRYGQTDEEKAAGAQNPRRNLNNPEVYIEMLVEQLSLPQKLINLKDNLLRVSKMGIKLPLDSKAPSNKVRLYEVEVEGNQSRVVILVRYPRDEFRTPATDLCF